jgi:tetratricopeptide (TPR) repeat protein
MCAGLRPKRFRLRFAPIEFCNHDHKVDRSGRLTGVGPLSLLCLISFCLINAIGAVAQLGIDSEGLFIRGLVTSSEGRPVPFAAVEVRDLRGRTMASGKSNSAGSFAFPAPARPGNYILIAATRLQVSDRAITLDRHELEVQIALPPAPQELSLKALRNDLVSANELSVSEKARKHLAVASQLFSRSDFAGAETEIGKTLLLNPDCAAAFSMRALLRMALKNPEDAVEDARHAIMLDPYESGGYVVLATAYNALKQFQNAEEALDRILAISPDSWQAQLEMAKALYGEGRFVLALRELDNLKRDFPDVHLVRANVLVRLERGVEARGEFLQFLDETPNDSRRERVKQIVNDLEATSRSISRP